MRSIRYHNAVLGAMVRAFMVCALLLIPPLLSYHLFFVLPFAFQNNLAERLGVAHVPVQGR